MSGELILIIEDNEKNMKLVRDLLQVKGYKTVESETAEEGIKMAKEKKPALILMDIQLPGMSGVEALGVLRSDPDTKDIPVIAVTASAMTQDRHKIMAAGFNGYQRKPIDIKEFLKEVRRVMGQGSDTEAAP
jgi:two-component system cell cycle response regulator DivK